MSTWPSRGRDVDDLRRELNEYLFYEFGPDMPEQDISPTMPFELELVGDLGTDAEPEPVFRFVANGEAHYAFADPALTCLSVAGMSVEDLRLQEAGASWISSRDPVDLDTARIGDERVPPTPERRRHLERLAERQAPHARVREGLFLATDGSYLALAEAPDGRAFVCADFLDEAEEVGFPLRARGDACRTPIGRLVSAGRL